MSPLSSSDRGVLLAGHERRVTEKFKVARVDRGELVGGSKQPTHGVPVTRFGRTMYSCQDGPRFTTGRRRALSYRHDGWLESWIVAEHGRLKGGQGRRRIDSQLVDKQGPEPLVGAQCVGLPPATVERQHKGRPSLLPQGILLDRHLGIWDYPLVLT